MQATQTTNRPTGVTIIGVLTAISGVILYYLFRLHVKAYFGKAVRAQTTTA